MKYKLTRQDASKYGWDGLDAYNYKFPNIDSGMSLVVVESKVRHGKVSSKDRKRLYFILEGEGIFYINNEKIDFKSGDLIVIPPKTEYDYESNSGEVKTLLIMEFLDK